MSDAPSRRELIRRRTQDGRDPIRLQAMGRAVWRPSIGAEISRDSVVKESLTTAYTRDELTTCKDFLHLQPERPVKPETDP